MNRGAVAEIDLSAISYNLKSVKERAKDTAIIAVVKADAYGHGSVETAKRLLKDGVDYLSVAFSEEAKELRHAGIDAPIIVLFDPDPKDTLEYNLIPIISDKKAAHRLSKEAERKHKEIAVHIKVDTGMGRLGFIGDEVKSITEIANLKGLRIAGIMSHFSDSDSEDPSFARIQISRFNTLKKELIEGGLNIERFHMANSAAIISLPESHFDAVRPGLMLYGISPFEDLSLKSSINSFTFQDLPLIQAMSLKTRIVSMRKVPSGTPISYGRTFITKRESLIGVISIGYADGFCRMFSNNADVLVKGRRVPVIGRVCMDLTMIDLTDIQYEAADDDEIVIMGRQGSEFISASELARRAGTISYEILTSLGRMARKIYKN